MDSEIEAIDYDAMDHAEVNRRFVVDLLDARADLSNVLDMGTGTAQIPIALCRVAPQSQVVGIDAAVHMLRVGQQNIAAAGLAAKIDLMQVDAKILPYVDGRFSTVMSNSIVHHIPEPRSVLAEAVRVCRDGGTLFVRDLLRPAEPGSLQHLVQMYAADANQHQRKMFAESLHAALSLDEIRAMVVALGFTADTVQATSDRHWTWLARKVQDLP